MAAEAPPSPRLPPFAEKFICLHYHQPLSSVHARFSMSDSFVDLPSKNNISGMFFVDSVVILSYSLSFVILSHVILFKKFKS